MLVVRCHPVDLLWFLLKHISAPGFDQSPQPVSPFRMGMASLARTPWDQLLDRYRYVEVDVGLPFGIASPLK